MMFIMDTQTKPEPESSPATSPPSLMDDLKRPLNKFFLGLSVVSIISGFAFSYYFYQRSKDVRAISTLLVGVTKVFDSSSLSPKLRVRDAEEQPITNDIYVVSYQVWNSGTLPIEPVDIRRPFKIELSGDTRLLDWTIAHCLSDPDVCKFRLKPDSNERPRSLILDWQHCDPQRGCQIQFLYTGSSNVAFRCISPFSGNGRLVDAGPRDRVDKRREALLIYTLGTLCGAVIGLMLGFASIIIMMFRRVDLLD
jgi:hypothetical protein